MTHMKMCAAMFAAFEPNGLRHFLEQADSSWHVDRDGGASAKRTRPIDLEEKAGAKPVNRTSDPRAADQD